MTPSRASSRTAARSGWAVQETGPSAGRASVPALLAADEPDLALADAMLDAVAARILTTAPPASDTGPSAVAVTMPTALPDLPALTDAERALMGEWLTRSLRSG